MDYLSAFVAKLTRLRAEAEQLDWTPPPSPELPPRYTNNRLQWRQAQTLPTGAPIQLSELRVLMPGTMQAHIKEQSNKILLMKIAAGGGKTHSGVEVAQWAARNGYRVLWAASRHNMFYDLAKLPHFDPALWYHWQPIHEQKGDDDPIPTTCIHADAQRQWTIKGYDSYDLCTQLCALTGHITRCDYRLQAKRKERIIFAMHQHLASGLAISEFDVVIVDELPLSAFIEHRLIPTSGIMLPGAAGPVQELLSKLLELSCNFQKRTIVGKELLDDIGPILTDVYAQVDHLPQFVPQIPLVQSADRVDNIPYWFLFDFLETASGEYDAWRNGWSSWLERVQIAPQGLHMHARAKPWAKLPSTMIVLDATANRGVYQQIFNRAVYEFNPTIQRRGRIYQVVGRLNGVGTMVEKQMATKQANEALTIAKQIASRYTGRIGIICHKATRVHFERAFGEGNVEHFFNLRGTNSLEDVSCLIVVGNPAPDIYSTINAAAALNSERIKPYGERDENGRVRPLYFAQDCEYAITDELRAVHDGKTPWRAIHGYWTEPELQTIYESSREAELVQALHRARPNVRDVDVWLLTSTPTGEPLDGIWDEPPLGPDGIHWKTWLRLEPWLNEQYENGETITIQKLVDFTGAGREWIVRNKWLKAIAEFQPEKWTMEVCLHSGKRGNPAKGITSLYKGKSQY